MKDVGKLNELNLNAGETGTLAALNVNPGDVVEFVSGEYAEPSDYPGYKWTVQEEPHWGIVARFTENGGGFINADNDTWIFRIVSRANSGPVRMVTRKEIVAGKYGNVRVYENGDVDLTRTIGGADEIRAAIATLTQIADALEESA